MHRFAALVIVAVMDVDIRMDNDVIIRVLAHLMEEQPALRCHVTSDGGQNRFLLRDGAAPPFEKQSAAGRQEKHALIEAASGTDFSRTALLWKLIHLADGERQRSTILIAGDHVILDRISFYNLIDRFFTLYDVFASGTVIGPVVGSASDLAPPLDSYLPPITPLGALPLFLRTLLRKAWYGDAMPLSRRAPAEERHTRVIVHHFSGEESGNIFGACRARAVGLHAFLMSALLMTLCAFLNRSRAVRVTASSNVCLRREFYVPPEHYGSYISGVVEGFALSRRTEIWKLAAEIEHKLRRAVQRGDHIRLPLLYEYLRRWLPGRVWLGALNGKQAGRQDPVSISNLIKSQVRSSYNTLKIERLYGYASQHGFGNTFTLYPVLLDGSLSFTIAYSEPLIGRREAERFAECLRNIVSGAIGGEVTTTRSYTK